MQSKAKFLIIRFSSIGDIVLTTPVIRCLKNQFDGEVSIHYLTKKVHKPILQHNPYIDKIHTIEGSTNEVIGELINEDFDFVIDLHHNLRSLRVKRKLKLVDFSFKKLNWAKWLMVMFKRNTLPNVHIVDRYMDTLNSWNIVNDQKGLDYFLSDEIEARSLPSFMDDEFIGITVGGGHATKTLPVERMVALIQMIDSNVVLLGGPEDIEKATQIEQSCGSNLFNACGKFSINESALIIKRSKAMITHDTGMMHIAAAFEKPIASIWGNTIPEFGMYPYIPQHPQRAFIHEVKDLSCRPCSKLGYDRCPKKHFKCMNEIDLKAVKDSVN